MRIPRAFLAAGLGAMFLALSGQATAPADSPYKYEVRVKFPDGSEIKEPVVIDRPFQRVVKTKDGTCGIGGVVLPPTKGQFRVIVTLVERGADPIHDQLQTQDPTLSPGKHFSWGVVIDEEEGKPTGKEKEQDYSVTFAEIKPPPDTDDRP